MKKNQILLMVIILFAILLRIAFFNGYGYGDDSSYAETAYRFSRGDFICADTNWDTRIGLLLPTAAFLKIFGTNDFSLTIFCFLCSIGSVILVYYFGGKFLNPKTGLLAAALLSFYPLSVMYSTTLYPDIPLELFFSLAIYYFLKGEGGNNRIFYFVSGLLTGYAYLIKESAIIIVFFFIAYFIFMKKSSINKILLLLAGFSMLFFAEMLFNWHFNKNPLIRFSILSHMSEHPETSLAPYPIPILKKMVLPIITLVTGHEFGLFYYFILPAVIYYSFKKYDKIKPFLIWIISAFLTSFYLPLSRKPFTTLFHEPRYTSIITIPSIIVLAHFFQNQKKIFKLLFFLFLFLTSISFIAFNWSGDRGRPYVRKEAYKFYTQHIADNLVIAMPLFYDFAYYSKYKIKTSVSIYSPNKAGKLNRPYGSFEIIPALKAVSNSYLIIPSFFENEALRNFKNKKLIKEIRQPSNLYTKIKYSELVRKFLGARKYSTTAEMTINIYYIN